MHDCVETISHTSPLGVWTQSHVKPERLRGLVEQLWDFEGVLQCRRERIFADGSYEVIVHLGARYRLVEVDGSTTTFPSLCFTGMRLPPELIEAPPSPATVLGIRLTPAGAHALLRRPLHDTLAVTADLEDVLPGSAELADRCAAVAGAEARLRVAVHWLEEQFVRGTRLDPSVSWAARQIEARGGAVSIASLREQTGTSRARFTARFREQVGATPKVFARIHRFRRALKLLLTDEERLSEVALTAGYYDQAHFTTEFRSFTGYTPASFLAAQRFPASVHVAEGDAPG